MSALSEPDQSIAGGKMTERKTAIVITALATLASGCVQSRSGQSPPRSGNISVSKLRILDAHSAAGTVLVLNIKNITDGRIYLDRSLGNASDVRSILNPPIDRDIPEEGVITNVFVGGKDISTGKWDAFYSTECVPFESGESRSVFIACVGIWSDAQIRSSTLVVPYTDEKGIKRKEKLTLR